MWDPKNGSNGKIKTRELPPFPGDSASAATAINDGGQVVGISGDCDQAVGRFSARHALLWDKNGKPTEIPDLGGTTWHTPMDINAAGDVAGFSNPPGAGDPEGDFLAHAFFWAHGAPTATDLGVLDGDALSEAFAVNAQDQVVGVSFGGATGSRAFLWQNGTLTNLNDLVERRARRAALGAGHQRRRADHRTDQGRGHGCGPGQAKMFIATPTAP